MIAWGQPRSAVRATVARPFQPRTLQIIAELRRTAEGGCPYIFER